MNYSDETKHLWDFVRKTTKAIGKDTQSIKVGELPKLDEHEKYFPETFYYIADHKKERFSYLSESVHSIFGIDKEMGENMHAAQFMGQIGHPEDLPAVLELFDKFNFYIKTLPFEKISDIRMLRCFRLKNKDGVYKKIVDQVTVLELNSEKIITKYLGAVSLAPLASDFGVASAIILDTTNGEELATFNLKNDEANALLTKREIQIMRLLAMGNRNQEVADKLGISVHTVQTHRKRIMGKLEISNPIDLVWKALELNLDMKD